MQELRKGGFVASALGGIYHHPMASTMKKILPNVLNLLRSIHTLWTPKMRQIIAPGMQAVLEIEDKLIAAALGNRSDILAFTVSILKDIYGFPILFLFLCRRTGIQVWGSAKKHACSNKKHPIMAQYHENKLVPLSPPRFMFFKISFLTRLIIV